MGAVGTATLSGRDRALLRAVAAGRCELGSGWQPVLLIEANGELRFASPETELSVGSKGTLVVFEAPEQPAEAGSAAADQPIPSGGRRSGR